MCMFYNKPKIKFFSKSRIAYKVMRKSGCFPYQTRKHIKRGTWMTATAPPGGNVLDYGFHVYLDKADAFRHLELKLNYSKQTIRNHIVIQVRVKGRVFGVATRNRREKSGLRIEQLFIPKVIKPLKQPKPQAT